MKRHLAHHCVVSTWGKHCKHYEGLNSDEGCIFFFITLRFESVLCSVSVILCIFGIRLQKIAWLNLGSFKGGVNESPYTWHFHAANQHSWHMFSPSFLSLHITVHHPEKERSAALWYLPNPRPAGRLIRSVWCAQMRPLDAITGL